MNDLLQKNIFVYNALNTSKCKLDENYSYLHSLLIHLENQQYGEDNQLEDFSKSVLDAFNLSNAFFPIDRVCLALTYSHATKIRVLSVANSSRVSNNLMPLKYSCFVSKKSSLLKTKTSNVRIYSDIDSIIPTYGEGGTAQRSLRLLKEMGIKSGITIPLTISNSFSGFLFLNSVYPKTFDELMPEDYSTLCLLKMIATSCLQKRFLKQINADVDLTSTSHKMTESSNAFSAVEFQGMLENILIQKYEKKITVKIESSVNSPFFFSVRPVAYLIIKACELNGHFFKSNEIDIKADLHKVKESFFLDIKMKDFILTESKLIELQGLKLFSEQDVFQENGSLILRSEVELIQEMSIDYSI